MITEASLSCKIARRNSLASPSLKIVIFVRSFRNGKSHKKIIGTSTYRIFRKYLWKLNHQFGRADGPQPQTSGQAPRPRHVQLPCAVLSCKWCSRRRPSTARATEAVPASSGGAQPVATGETASEHTLRPDPSKAVLVQDGAASQR